MEVSEGPVPTSMKTELEQIIVECNTADNGYNTAIEKELKKLDKQLN